MDTIIDGAVALIHYTLTNDQGEVLDSSEGGDPLPYLHGARNIVPGLEKELIGMKVGGSKDVDVASGMLWVAMCHGGSVLRINPANGTLLQKIDFPCVETTACAFGGEKLDRLFVTTGIHKSIEESNAGRVFVVDGLGVNGTKAFAFAG